MGSNKGLTDLDLTGCPETEASMASIGGALASNSSLTKLRMHGGGMDPGAFMHIAEGIRSGTSNGTLRLEDLEA